MIEKVCATPVLCPSFVNLLRNLGWLDPQRERGTNPIVCQFIRNIFQELTCRFSAFKLYSAVDTNSGKLLNFKDTFCRTVPVHCVGVWCAFPLRRLSITSCTHGYSHRDTVSSVGVIRKKVLPETAHGMKHVCIFRHALALDERRVKFLPEYVNEGVCKSENGPANSNSGPGEKKSKREEVPETKGSSHAIPTSEGMSAGHVRPQISVSTNALWHAIDTKTTVPDPSKSRLIHTKEVWFAGTHSDV